MIYYDITRMGAAKHRSGLTRLSSRLLGELGDAVVPVSWDGALRRFVAGAERKPVAFSREDWLFTVEMFCEAERPGISAFVGNPPCRLGAMFHDAIPVKFPHITWPQSVQRHPEYMKLLAGFERTWAISEATRRDFVEFWRWQGTAVRATTEVIFLGADFDGSERVRGETRVAPGRPSLLCVGIVEPRKNQAFLLDVAEALWCDKVDFELHVVGRINPHFGRPVAARMRALQRRERRFRFHEAADDGELARLYAGARVLALPTIAEGCGLPLLEALWRGVPCVASDLPVIRENALGGGCILADANDPADWQAKLRLTLTDEAANRRLQTDAMARPLPRWRDTAAELLRAMRG